MEKKSTSLQCPVCKARHVAREQHGGDNVYASTCQNCGHFFKFRAVPPFKSSVTLTVNGQLYTVGNEFGPSTTLNEFLREKRVSMGTKVLCKQGGCGVCIVTAKMPLNPGQPATTTAINSCLCPLFMCDGWEVTTTEGIGSTKTQLHKIQQTLADYGGTQCGFCSPGHVMNMYGLMQKYPNLTKQQVEDHFEGNICRCTGYRPILDAMKSLVPTTDIEDLTRIRCSISGEPCTSSSGLCDGRCSDKRAIKMVFETAQWHKAASYSELLQLLQQFQGQRIRLLGANTGTGPFPEENIDNFDVIIDATAVPEFYTNTYDAATKQFSLGACVTLTDMLELFTREAAKSTDNGNFDELKKYMYRVASFPIRSRGTWAGNLMLKNKHKTFPSDLFNMFTVLNASLTIGPTPQDVVSVDAFYHTDMTGKCLSKVTFNAFTDSDVTACFKVMPRSQNSLAHVNGAFRCSVNKTNGYLVSGQPIISIGGISAGMHRATKTEAYLVGKQLTNPATLAGALTVMATEVVPTADVSLPSIGYRKTVACALLYKFFLRVLGDSVGVRYRSGKDVLHDIRPLSSGKQTYDTKQQEWPLNQPLKKLEADVQVSGEAVYTDDIPELPGQLYGAFVTSTQANATIQAIDSSAALRLAGVVRVITSADIPANCKNDVQAPLYFVTELEAEEMFAAGSVKYYGQSVALVLAESQKLADKAAKLVQVTYSNIQPPIFTIDDAIAAKSFYKKPMPDVVIGNPDSAIANAAHVSSGTFYVGKQIHFHMETQATNCVPTEDGLDFVTTTQWPDSIQQAVSAVTGIAKSKINVSVKRLGGAYGGKITRNNIVASACGLAAVLTNRPVRMRMDIERNHEMLGKRLPYKAKYQVGHGNDGRLAGISVTIYVDPGCIPNEDDATAFPGTIDNAYYCPNWRISLEAVKTNTAINTACRAPGTTPGVLMIENMMEHVARTVDVDPVVVKTLNLYQQGQVTPSGMPLNHCNISTVMNQLMLSAQVDLRNQTFSFFNRDNRWKKKALAVVPLKFGLTYVIATYTCLVSVHHKDGSVMVQHGGIEMGQGINTKVAQVCAYELGIPVSMVTVKATTSQSSANDEATGGSITSETCCKAAIECCQKILARMAPIKAKMVQPTWVEIVDECWEANVVITERYQFAGAVPTRAADVYVYNSYGAACTEVELDVLTGEYQINRVDVILDCGESLNPAVDIGQVEGAFMMGIGYNTTEDVKYDPATGRCLSRDTWLYHPPTNKDIPVDFRVALLKNAPNPLGVLRSKASGEPPLCMSCSVLFALRKCVEEARKEIGQTAGYFDFFPPATVDKVQELCLVDPAQFVLQ